jgi:hypothetical protein
MSYRQRGIILAITKILTGTLSQSYSILFLQNREKEDANSSTDKILNKHPKISLMFLNHTINNDFRKDNVHFTCTVQ